MCTVLCFVHSFPSGSIVLRDSPPANLVDLGMSLLSLLSRSNTGLGFRCLTGKKCFSMDLVLEAHFVLQVAIITTACELRSSTTFYKH